MDNKQIAKEVRSAIKSSNTEKVAQLISSNPGVLNMMTPFGTWLHDAASRGNLEIVKKLVELGLDFNTLGGIYGGGALNEAASEGHFDVVRYLLSCGADLDISEPERNPLFGAISNGSPEIAELLIESGIDTNVKYSGESMREMDALAFAKEQGQKEIIKLLEVSKGLPTEKHNNHHAEILERFVKCFGPVKNTINEVIPGSKVSVNIHLFPSSKNNDFLTLVTTGMSDEPMDYSSEENVFKYAELILKLPSSWIIEKDKINDHKQYWPLGWIRKVAHFPHIYDGWIEEGVILPNGEPSQQFSSNTKLSCLMVCGPQEPELESIHTSEGIVNIFTLVPIYEEERILALEKGHDYLIKRLSEQGYTDILDINRVNVGI